MSEKLIRFLVILSLCTLLTLGQYTAIQTPKHIVKNTHAKRRVIDEQNSCSNLASEWGKKAGDSTTTTLNVFYKYGPCNPKNITTSLSEILANDEVRVRSIMKSMGPKVKKDAALQASTLSGAIVGGANYFAAVNLGTPWKRLNLEIDTASDITWTQCSPCTNCFEQNQTIFDPSESSTYSNISCASSLCFDRTCAESNNCGYELNYDDGLSTTGLMGSDHINFCDCEGTVFEDFVFGCGYNNVGSKGGTDGRLGMGRGQLSFPSQTAGLYRGYFSYCLPASESSVGYLTLAGNGGARWKPYYTKLSEDQYASTFYAVDLYGINVGEDNVTLPVTVPIVIDTGTTFSSLPRKVYNGVRELFNKEMEASGYDSVPPVHSFDACYNISGYSDLEENMPNIIFNFNDDIEVYLLENSVVLYDDDSVACLALVPYDKKDFAVFGSHQQRSLEVICDLGRQQIGIAHHGC